MTTTKGWAILEPAGRGFGRTDDGTVALYPTKGAAKNDAFAKQRVVRVEIRVTQEGRKA